MSANYKFPDIIALMKSNNLYSYELKYYLMKAHMAYYFIFPTYLSYDQLDRGILRPHLPLAIVYQMTQLTRNKAFLPLNQRKY